MANIRTLLAILTVAFVSIANHSDADAHNVNLASFKIRQVSDDRASITPSPDSAKHWILTIDTALHNLHQSLLKTEPVVQLIKENSYNKQLATEYLKKNTHISFNGEDAPVKLQSIQSSIGNHQSIFVFRIIDPPQQITSIAFHVPAMSDNENQMNLMKISGDNWNNHIVLSKKNNFRGSLTNVSPKPSR